ncbi:YihY/virulence factor BrkB family protein (plasmid) [Rhizobium sp. CB3171]|uniref:YihY/virulence factor BrkB family protein n=1 Tax=Rhizobium sp. CB3171 TaxID=3039157 RepID=UPI0024B0D25A|nr:YihY/virulence factor BrkB family protein [Rhizobium sp. CB3171]WFU06483.1 YihY/virulence factor BrkB family protein [Rhizobium sp. CB3171]
MRKRVRHGRPQSTASLFQTTSIAILALLVARAFVKREHIEAGPAKAGDHALHQELGRFAAVPEQIPARGLRDVFWRVIHEVSDDRITLVAAGVTFYLLLALFPALAALVSLYGFVADPASISDHLRSLALLLPPGSFDMIADRLNDLVERRSETLSVALFLGLGVALWSTHSGTLALFDAMNVAYEEAEKRGLVRLNLIALCFTLCAILAAILVIGSVAIMPLALSLLWLDQWKENLVLILRWPILLVLMIIAVTAIYRFGPSREPAKVRWLTWGAALATAGWIAMSLLFSIYLKNFANYDATYGTLGALIGFLIWIWLSMVILLVGAEVNAELEHQTAVDTTIGPALPMGSRGAHVADTIGKSFT